MKTLQELTALSHIELVIMVTDLQAQLQSLKWESECFQQSAQEHTTLEIEWMKKFVALKSQIAEATQ